MCTCRAQSSHAAPAPYLVPLHLLPEQHIIFQESSLQTDKMLELQTGDGIEEDPSEQEDLFGGAHPQAFGLRGTTTEKWELKPGKDDRTAVERRTGCRLCSEK